MLFIFIQFIFSVYTQSNACGAGPLIYGPDCTATDCMQSRYDDMISYTIDEIISGTNIKCEGRGMNSVFSCTDNKFDWYDLGVLQEGGVGTIYWGPNAGCPQIRCKGQPLPTEFKWSWKMIPNKKFCCGKNSCDTRCCGNICLKATEGCCWDVLCSLACCGGICYDPLSHKCCTSGDKEGHNIYSLCGINSECTGYPDLCCPNTCHECCIGDDGKSFTCAGKGQSCCGDNPCDSKLFCCSNGCKTWQECERFPASLI